MEPEGSSFRPVCLGLSGPWNSMKKILFISLILMPFMTYAAPSLRITEFMYDAPGSDSGKEWIEIFNYGADPVRIGTGSVSTSMRFYDGSKHLLQLALGEEVLQPGSFAIIAANAAQWQADHPAYQGTLFSSSMALANASGTIGLVDAHETTPFISVSYDAVQGAAGDGFTLRRTSLTDTLDDTRIWILSTVAGGTPGYFEAFGIPSSSPTSTPTSTPPVLPTSTPPDIQDTSPVQAQNPGTQVIFVPQMPLFSYEIRINELLPNPAGTDTEGEWIELYNDGSSPVELAGWKVQDNSSTVYTVSEDTLQLTSIGPHDYFVIPRIASKLSLNNTGGDIVKLFWPDGQLADVMLYSEEATEGHSYARFPWGWQWAQPTQKTENAVIGNPGAFSDAAVDLPDEVSPDETVVNQNVYTGDGVLIDRILPNPAGNDDDEWIELSNTSSSTIALLGWQIDDAPGGSRPYIIGSDAVIAAHATRIIRREESGIVLNNDGDTVRLLSPDGAVKQEISYRVAPENTVYRLLDNGSWAWGPERNFIDTLSVELASSTVQVLGMSRSEVSSIKELADLPDDTEVLTTGIILVPPNTLYKRQVYLLLHEDDDALLELYDFHKRFPKLAPGDIVQIRGIKATASSGQLRLTIEDTDAIEKKGSGTVPEPALVSIGRLGPDDARSFVTLSGVVERVSQRSLTLIDEGISFGVYPEFADSLTLSQFSKGDTVQAAGFFMYNSERPRVYVFLNGHIQKIQSSPVDYETASTTTGAVLAPVSPAPFNPLLYSASIPLIVIAGFIVKKFLLPYLS